MSNGTAQKKSYIQTAGIIAALAVVLMHTNQCFWNFSRQSWWIGADIIENISYFAVPVFYMISGVTLMDYRERYSTRTYFKKRIIKTVIPFLIWSVIGIIWCILAEGRRFTGIYDLYQNFVTSGFVGIYWFFFPLYALYLFIPFLSLIPEKNRKKGFGYAIIAILILNSAVPFISMITGIAYNDTLYFPLVGFAAYLLIGYWIDHYEIKKAFRIVIYAAAVLALAVMVTGTIFASYKADSIDETFKGYNGILCIIYSSGVFTFFRYMKQENNVWLRIASFLSPLTFGIYLIHWYILQLIYKLIPIDDTNIIFRLIVWLVVFALSSLIVWVIKKIPGLKHIVP